MATFVARSALLSQENSAARRLIAINQEIAAILTEYPNLRLRTTATRRFLQQEAGSPAQSEAMSIERAAAGGHLPERITRARVQ